MRAEKKIQVGVRVKREIHEALERLATAERCSIGHYAESVLGAHIARLRDPDMGGGVWEQLLTELDGRLAKFAQRQEVTHARELSAAVLQVQKEFSALNAIKAMIDGLVQILAPKDYETYAKTVRETMRRMTAMSENGNGAPQ